MPFRMTEPTRDVLLALAHHDPERGSYGNELARETGRAVGTIYPLLARLERAGVLRSKWEQVDPHEAGRPAIRFWYFTAAGARFAEEERQAQLARLRTARPARAPRPPVPQRPVLGT